MKANCSLSGSSMKIMKVGDPQCRVEKRSQWVLLGFHFGNHAPRSPTHSLTLPYLRTCNRPHSSFPLFHVGMQEPLALWVWHSGSLVGCAVRYPLVYLAYATNP